MIYIFSPELIHSSYQSHSIRRTDQGFIKYYHYRHYDDVSVSVFIMGRRGGPTCSHVIADEDTDTQH